VADPTIIGEKVNGQQGVNDSRPAVGRRRRRRWLNLQRRDSLLGVSLFVPAGSLLAMVIGYPLIFGVAMAFFSVQPYSLNRTFVGWQNFVDVLTGDQFWHSLWVGIQWAAGAMILQVTVGVGFALLLNKPFYGRAVVRSLVLFPYLVPIVVAVLIWKWMFNDVYGIINHLLMSLGRDGPVLWLSSPRWALLSVILVGTWKMFPFVVIVVLARLQTIPRHLYDAAQTDGASGVRLFLDVTLPELRGVLTVTIFLRFIWDFNDFNLIALLTGGGPVQSTQTLPILVYEHAFSRQALGIAASTADVALVILSFFFVIYYWLIRKQERAL
jgi:multiple sugar transport system permease protein